MDLKAFENLKLIPKLLYKIEAMEERLKKFTPPLTTKKEVAKFLNKSQSTVNRYIGNGLLIEGKHFYRKNGKILVFIEEAVIEFRLQLDRGLVYEKTTI